MEDVVVWVGGLLIMIGDVFLCFDGLLIVFFENGVVVIMVFVLLVGVVKYGVILGF